MVITEFLEGNRWRFTMTFLTPDEDGTATDPDTVTVYRRKLGGSLDDLETFTYADDQVSKTGVGIYAIELDFADAGQYVLGFEGTGACVAYTELNVTVAQAQARP